MRFSEALADLDGRRPDRMIPTLDRIEALAALMGDPQLTYPTIHITGTNGKTTTARIATEVACRHGLTTGLYTSPHLLSVTERLEVCGRPMTEGEFAAEYANLLPYLETLDAKGEERVTYFEVLTALAYLWFADAPVALGVFEVGMGGIWDATNLIASDVAVIGEIGLDHPELGSTLAEVATEKAGIVKAGKVAVVREQADDAMEVVRARADEVGAQLLLEHRDFELDQRLRAVGGQSLAIRGLHAVYDDLFLPLFGEYAGRNAAAAVAAVEALLGRALDVEAVREAFADVRSPGRLDVVARHPLVVFDGAHNPAGAEALGAAMREFFTWERLHLVLGVSANKDLAGMVRALAPLSDRAYAAANDSSRTGDAGEVAAALAAQDVPTEVFSSVAEALDAARESAGPADAVLVTGSLYTVADAHRAMGN